MLLTFSLLAFLSISLPSVEAKLRKELPKKHQENISFQCPSIGSTWITTWKHNAKSAISLTFDDAMPVQYKHILPLLDPFGFKVTFFLNTKELERSTPNSWGQSTENWRHWETLQSLGHEIGSHTVTHSDLTKISFHKVRKEFIQSCQTIKHYIPKAKCETIAYPYGIATRKVRKLAKEFFLAARQGRQGINPSDPSDLMNIQSIVPRRSTSIWKMKFWIKKAIKMKGWMAWMFHGTQGQGWEPLPLGTYKRLFQAFQEQQSKLWIAPFGSVAKYILQRQHTRIHKQKISSTLIHITLDSPLSNQLDTDLTFAVIVPKHWFRVQIKGEHPHLVQSLSAKHCQQHRILYFSHPSNQTDIQISPY